MKYKIGDKFKNKIDGMLIWIIGFQGEEYVVTWASGFPNSLDESHLDEYYTKITKYDKGGDGQMEKVLVINIEATLSLNDEMLQVCTPERLNEMKEHTKKLIIDNMDEGAKIKVTLNIQD
jgi:hypothetical protein